MKSKEFILEAKKPKVTTPKPRNFVAKNAPKAGAGAHKDKKKAAKQGEVKHKSRMTEGDEPDEQYLDKVISDLHKDALGMRPDREFGREWMSSNYEEKLEIYNNMLKNLHSDMDEATGDEKFDTIMRTIKKGTKKQATADRRERDTESRRRSRDAFGPSPADRLSIRSNKDVEEGIGGMIAGGVGQFFGNKIDPLAGEIMRAHGEIAGRKAEYTIRKYMHLLQKELKQQLDSGEKEGVAEGDYPDGSSIKTPDVDEWKQQYQQAVMAVKNAKTKQEYEAASDRAGRIKDLLASKGIKVGPALGQQGVAEGYTTEKQIMTRIRQIMHDRKLSGTESNAGELHRLKQQLKDLRSQQSVEEGSDWGEPREILEDVLQTLEREVEWPLTEVMDPKEVRQLLSPIVRAVNDKIMSMDRDGNQ